MSCELIDCPHCTAWTSADEEFCEWCLEWIDPEGDDCD